MAEDPMMNIEISAIDALKTATELRMLMGEVGVERFPKDHVVRKLETKLVEGSKAAVGWSDGPR